MERITSYTLDDNGTYTAVVEGVHLTENDTLMIDNNFALEADVEVVDGRTITMKQRKKIFALLNDIYLWSGQPPDDLRQMFQFYLELMKGYKPISLSNTTVTKARELIETIIEWVFIHDVPLNYKTSNLLKEDSRFLYLATINRKCVICGKPHSDLAHREAVGAGRNRKTIDHNGHHVLALCRSHHQEQHQMGVDSFDQKYMLTDAWLKVDDKLNQMLKGASK